MISWTIKYAYIVYVFFNTMNPFDIFSICFVSIVSQVIFLCERNVAPILVLLAPSNVISARNMT